MILEQTIKVHKDCGGEVKPFIVGGYSCEKCNCILTPDRVEEKKRVFV